MGILLCWVPDQAQLQRDPRFQREYRMARSEDEPQNVVIDHLIQGVL